MDKQEYRNHVALTLLPPLLKRDEEVNWASRHQREYDFRHTDEACAKAYRIADEFIKAGEENNG